MLSTLPCRHEQNTHTHKRAPQDKPTKAHTAQHTWRIIKGTGKEEEKGGRVHEPSWSPIKKGSLERSTLFSQNVQLNSLNSLVIPKIP